VHDAGQRKRRVQRPAGGHFVGGDQPTLLELLEQRTEPDFALVQVRRQDNGSSSADIIAPRFTPVAWGVLVGFNAVYLLVRCQDCRSGYSTWNHSRTSSG
jgi:hypothetical protein